MVDCLDELAAEIADEVADRVVNRLSKRLFEFYESEVSRVLYNILKCNEPNEGRIETYYREIAQSIRSRPQLLNSAEN